MPRTQSDIEQLLENPDSLSLEELEDCIAEVNKVLFDISVNHPARQRMVDMVKRLYTNRKHLKWVLAQPPTTKKDEYVFKLMVQRYLMQA
jgi:hypothetical protein